MAQLTTWMVQSGPSVPELTLFCQLRRACGSWAHLCIALRRRFAIYEQEEDIQDAQSQIEQDLSGDGLLRREKAFCRLELAETLRLASKFNRNFPAQLKLSIEQRKIGRGRAVCCR